MKDSELVSFLLVIEMKKKKERKKERKKETHVVMNKAVYLGLSILE